MYFLYLTCVLLLIFSPFDTNAFVCPKTCRSAFLASQAWASYWSKLVPTVHLSRLAPWHSYSPSELRDAHIRYAATHRRWESPLPTFKPPLRLQPPPGWNISRPFAQRWRLIRGTRWAWHLRYSTGEVNFCDLRTSLVIGKWSARGPVVGVFIESRSPNECVLCHWKNDQWDNISECVLALRYFLTTEALDTGRFEIVATSVTFEQESLNSPITLSFRVIHRIPVQKGISLGNNFSDSLMVLWRNHLIGSYVRVQPWSHGLFLWSMTEKYILYFEVGDSFHSSPGTLNPNSRQMEFVPRCTKVFDDVLFVSEDKSSRPYWDVGYCPIHLPSLVISTPMPGGSLSLPENASAVLLPNRFGESRAKAHFPADAIVYSIPSYSSTHPRYCFITERSLEQTQGVMWDVFEVEIDLSIPGPIKTFSGVSWQCSVQRSTSTIHDIDADLLLHLQLGREGQPRVSPSIRFLRVGTLDKGRLARLGGVDQMHLSGLSVDRVAGYVIIWDAEDWPQSTGDCGHICWLDERKAGDMVYSRTKELITSWSRGLLRRF